MTRRQGRHISRNVWAGKAEEDWKTQAVCRNNIHYPPWIWFPEVKNEAWLSKSLCQTCPVMKECREYSRINHEEWGTWGGLTEWDRGDRTRRNRKNRKQQPTG